MLYHIVYRKIQNGRQIMFQCDRGYSMIEGPSGATCIAGQWSPPQLPRCVEGSHPRVWWTRSNRSQLGNQARIEIDHKNNTMTWSSDYFASDKEEQKAKNDHG